jgi:cell division cycle protein 20 (cofactor of APC complex)
MEVEWAKDCSEGLTPQPKQ